MGYLIAQILFCLLIAAIIGFIVGWLLRGRSLRSRERYVEEQREERARQLKSRLSTAVQGSNVAPVATPSVTSGAPPASEPVATTDSPATSETVRKKKNDSPATDEPDPYEVEEIEGIGRGFGKRLRTIDIKTTKHLIDRCATTEGCKQVASTVDVEEFVVRKWVSMADLMRVPGIRGQYAELLEASGIHSVQELAGADTQGLASKMSEVNVKEKRTRKVARADTISEWIDHAKSLSPKISN